MTVSLLRRFHRRLVFLHGGFNFAPTLDDFILPIVLFLLKGIEDDPGMCQRIEQKIIHLYFPLQTIILIKQLKLVLFDQVSTD